MSSIFLSHNHADKPFVRRLAQDLQAAGVRVWLDEAELMIGDSLIEKIREGIDEMDYVGVIISNHSVHSRWVQREVDIAMNQEIEGTYVKVLPFLIDDCDLPGFLKGKLYADFRKQEQYKEEFSKVLRRLLPDTPAAFDTLIELPEYVNSIGMKFLLIPAGSFIMGSPASDFEADLDEKPAHRVEISAPFYLGKYPVTQAQWQAVMGNNPSNFKSDDGPVEMVSWDDTQAFICKLNKQENVIHYRLPTEAEWEYATRGGTQTIYGFGNDPAQLGDYAWYLDNSNRTHQVGQKQPNSWGLYDLHGNVWEWVQDWYDEKYYQNSPERDPQGPEQGEHRVFRGGSWVFDGGCARSACRGRDVPGRRVGSYIGFRIARDMQQVNKKRQRRKA